MKYVIRERRNPQSGTYYVAEGRVSNKRARGAKSIYGSNVMHTYETEAEYEAAKAYIIATGGRFI